MLHETPKTLNALSIIEKKRDGHELKPVEIQFFIRGVTAGSIPDYQASAFLMAVYLKGMVMEETVALTQAMLESGQRFDLGDLPGVKVDKHSTGGIGDKVSILLAPLAAACGLKVPMMAGRGLGHSGGTLDKLESIPGFRVQLELEEFRKTLSHVGCSMIGQTASVAPADKKLYALRDVTGTVECIPLITASILSKKLAEGTDALVLDVKVGSGAFMKTQERARQLARSITQVAKKMKLRCRALLTDMNQPLGYAVGNSLEIFECIEIFKNIKNPEASSCDLRELTIQLCAEMIELSGKAKNITAARKLAINKLQDGSAWEHFQKMVASQGGRLKDLVDPRATHSHLSKTVWNAPKSGYLSAMHGETIGRLLVELGGGRTQVTDPIDHQVGFLFHQKLGAHVKAGQPLVSVYHQKSRSSKELAQMEERFQSILTITRNRKSTPKLILEKVGGNPR